LALEASEEIRMAMTTRKAKTATPKKAEAKPKLVQARAAKVQMVSHEEIERLAHRFWMERGYEDGQAEMDWFRAEQELLRGKAS
jgi:Protein of unknown function (DUF2934)